MRREGRGQTDHRLSSFLNESVEQIEQQRTLVAQPTHCGLEPRLEQIEARRAEQIGADGQSHRECGQQPLASAIEAIDETLKSAARDGGSEVRCRGVLEVMAVVDDEA